LSETPVETSLIIKIPEDEDCKFVAVALTHHAKPAIANAVDSDWRNYEITLAEHGVSLNFLCPELATKA